MQTDLFRRLPGAPGARPFALAGGAIAISGVLIATLVSLALKRFLDFEVLIGVFLTAIMVVAITVGRRSAVLAAVLGWATYNYFVEEPRYVLQLYSVQDLVTAALFISVGLVIGTLSDRLRAAALRAETHARQLDALLKASRAFSEPTREGELHQIICRSIGEACHADVWLYDDHAHPLFATSHERDGPRDLILKSGLEAPTGHTAVAPGWRARPLETGGHRLGCLVWAVDESRVVGQTDLAHVAVMSDLAAPAMLRLRDAEVRAEAAVVLRTDALRNALLSSISHDFRTPLSSIMASASALLDYGAKFSEDTWRDLLNNIVREGERLNRLVAKVLDMTRIQGGALRPQVQALLPLELIERSLDGVRSVASNVTFEAPRGSAPAVLADPVLLETALTNVLENAARFSPPQGLVRVTLDAEAEAVLICVIDDGPGVPDHLLDVIFEAFRSLEPERARSGLGLSIVRAFVEACGGRVWATSREDSLPGLRVWIQLPRQGSLQP